MESLADDFRKAGVRSGAVLLCHSSLSSFGHVDGGAETVIRALLAALGPEGTLCIPTLSYLFTTETNPVFDVRSTPTNLGAIPAAFLRMPGVMRSVHPTHSVAALGPQAAAVTENHWRDTTPVGEHSPFRRVRDLAGQVAFLGCGTRCNTSIHGVEEAMATPPPYLLQAAPITYTVTDAAGQTRTVAHRRHDFAGTGQRYERVVPLMPPGTYCSGRAGTGGGAVIHVLDAPAMWAVAAAALAADPLCFVDPVPAGAESHVLVAGAGGEVWRYRVV
jgi:aminoglycoside 3-N-acetyltransferase